MEDGQADQVAVLKKVFLSKWYAKSLSSSKVIYARDEDPVDTVMIRNLSPQTKDYAKVFGMKDATVIRNVFMSMLKLSCMEMKNMKKRVKYVKKEDFDALEKLAKEFEKEITLIKTSSKIDNMKTNRVKHGANGFIDISIASKAEFPYIKLSNENENGEFMTCVYLFIGEMITLMKYLNTRFVLTSSYLKLGSEKLQTDNFF